MWLVHSPTKGFVAQSSNDDLVSYTTNKNQAMKFGMVLHIAQWYARVGGCNIASDVEITPFVPVTLN